MRGCQIALPQLTIELGQGMIPRTFVIPTMFTVLSIRFDSIRPAHTREPLAQ
jgi:hypothetical protein